ncbi:MFS transporter [Rhodoferax sp.]|uniref:MFS transporter n=1 Tax=Rhodoferax sp. TaxID=50421 RepID=UPI00374C915A
MASNPPSPRFGDWVVRAAFVLAVFGWGIGFYGPPIYLHAVLQRTGWPLGLVSAAVTLHFLSGVLVIANLPRLYARWGLARTVITGSVVTACGLLGWALAAQPWQLFLAALLSGTGWVTMGSVTVNAVVTPWHPRTLSSALATAYNGGTIGGVLFSPLWMALIAWLGFAGAALLIGAVMVLVMVVLGTQIFARTPQPQHLVATPGTAAHAAAGYALLPGAALWQNRRFQTLALSMAIGLFAHLGLLAHLLSLLVPTLGAQTAGWVIGAIPVCAILGRSLTARLLLRGWDGRSVAGAGYVVQALGAAVFMLAGPGAAGAVGWLVLGVLLFGVFLGNGSYLPPLIARGDFAPVDASRAVALIVAMGQATYAFAPVVFGAVLSAGGASPEAGLDAHTHGFFVAVAATLLVAAACFWMPLKPRCSARADQAI